jgi:hypothetical protein
MKTTKILLFVLLISITGFILYKMHQVWEIRHKDGFQLITFRTENGWGYKISRNKRVIIYQESIPTHEGKLGFRSQKEAGMAGQLVLLKLKNNIAPRLSHEEVEKILFSDRN